MSVSRAQALVWTAEGSLVGGGHMPQTDRQTAGEQAAMSQGANLGTGDLRLTEDRQRERDS